MENDADPDTVREVYERAIANIPPIQEKRHWKRYIYLWINYALYEELEVKVSGTGCGPQTSRLAGGSTRSSPDLRLLLRTQREPSRCTRPVWTSSLTRR